MSSVTLTIKNPQNGHSYSEQFSAQEWENAGYNKILNEGNRISSAAILTPLVIPVRVDKWKNFAKDLFLPLTVNMAIKINNFALKVIAILICFIFDIATFPIRIITAIPWKIAAPKKEENPFYKSLKEKNVPENILQGEFVMVKIIKTSPTFNNRISGEHSNFFTFPLNYMPLGELLVDKNAWLSV